MTADSLPHQLSAQPTSKAVGRRMLIVTLLQFFLGGVVLHVAAFAVIASISTFYDGALTFIGMTVTATVIALASMILAMLLGLPVRLIPSLRSLWLANGEITVIGALLGLLGCVLTIAVAPVTSFNNEFGAYEVRDFNQWILLATWTVFAMSVAHLVWPTRWRRPAKHR